MKFYPDWYENILKNSNEKTLLAEKIALLTKQYHPKKALEVGMGTAPIFSQKLSPLVDEYWIVEREPLKVKLPEKVNYIHANFEEAFFDQNFDLILLSHVVYYFTDLNQALQKIYQMLSPNGKAYFVVNGKEKDYGRIKQAFAEISDRSFEFTYDILMKNLKGYSVVEHSIDVAVKYADYENLYESLRLFFDLFPIEYQNHRNEIVDWLRNNIEGNFIMNQKILEVTRDEQ